MASEFLKFLAQPAKSAEWTMASCYLPVVKAAQQQAELVKLTNDDPNFSTALQQLPGRCRRTSSGRWPTLAT